MRMFLSLAFLMWATSASANEYVKWNDCVKGAGDTAIKACTWINNSKTVSRERRFLAFYYRGNAHFRIRNYEKAERDYSQALPGPLSGTQKATVYVRRGRVYLFWEQYEKAIRDFEQARLADRKTAETAVNHAVYAWAYYGHGLTLQRRGRTDAAIRHFSTAIRFNRYAARFYIARARAHEANKNEYDAIRDYEAALKQRPKAKEVQTARAALKRLQKTQQAKRQGGHLAKASNAQLAKSHYRQGLKLMRQGRAAEAIPHYNIAIRNDSRNAVYYWARAQAFEAVGKAVRAYQDYQMSWKIDPQARTASSARKAAKRLYRTYGSVRAAAKTRPAKGKAAGAKKSSDSKAFHAALQKMVRTGVRNPAKGLAMSDEILRRYRLSIFYPVMLRLIRRGYYVELERADEAARELNTAMAAAEEWIRKEPNGGQPYRWRATAHAFGKNWTAAVLDMTRAIQRKPKNEIFRLGRGDYFSRLGDHESAILDYRTAARQHPKSTQPYGRLCGVYVRMAKPALALKNANIAIRRNANRKYGFVHKTGYLTCRARALIGLRRYRQAIADLKFLDTDKFYYVAAGWFYRGVAYEGLGRKKRALADFKQAFKRNPRHPDFRAKYRELGLKKGD